MSNHTPLLAARGAGRRFGARVALRPTDLELAEAESVALVGANGAGKSTLLAILAGALKPTEGAVARRPGAKTGWAPQRAAQYGRLSARENVELFAGLAGEADPRGIAGRLLAELELPDEREPSANLSVGNRQRLNLAIALIGEPDALLLDEPTASLDPEGRAQLWARVRDARERRGLALVFATQNLEEVEHEADRVVALRDGAAVYEGSVAGFDGLASAAVSS